MADLSQAELNVLRSIVNSQGDPRNAYYTALMNMGIEYGALARGVVLENTVSGRMANAYMANYAESIGRPLSASEAKSIGIDLMRADLGARVLAGGKELDYKEIQDYHVDVFTNHGLSGEAWTATAVLNVFGRQAERVGLSPEVGKRAAWDMMTQSGYAASGAVSNGGVSALMVASSSPVLPGLTRNPGFDPEAARWVATISAIAAAQAPYVFDGVVPDRMLPPTSPYTSSKQGVQGNGLGASDTNDPRGPWQMPANSASGGTGAGSTTPSTTVAPASSTGASAPPSVKSVVADPGGFGLGPGSRDGGNSMGAGSSPARPSPAPTVKAGTGSGLSNAGSGSTTRTVSTPAGPQQVDPGSRYTPSTGGPSNGGSTANRTVSTSVGPQQVKSSAPSSVSGVNTAKSTGRADRDQQGSPSPSRSSPSPSSNTRSASTSGSSSARDRADRSRRPVLLDLDGNGIRVNEFRNSTTYADIGNDGFKRRTAWAGAGDGVLFVDADGDGRLSGRREVVFTDWDPSADTDMQALRQVFDTNGNGLLDAGDAQWAQFRVMVTNADGTTTARSLAELGIQSINLITDETHYDFKDGSKIEGETIFTRTNGTTGKAVSMALAGEAAGYVVTETRTVDAAGAVTVFLEVRGTDGALVRTMSRLTSADGNSVTIRFDDDGNGVVDRVLTDATVLNADGSRARTETSRTGAGVLIDTKTTVTSADGRTITITRDEQGGGFATERETQVTAADNSLTVTVSDLAANGAVISSERSAHSADRLTRTVSGNNTRLSRTVTSISADRRRRSHWIHKTTPLSDLCMRARQRAIH